MPVAILVAPDGHEEALIGSGHRAIRLSVVQGTLLAGPVRLDFVFSGLSGIASPLHTLQRLITVHEQARWPAPASLSSRMVRRALLIRTLDALATDPRHRAVATALFGDETVRAEWTAGSDHLRSRTRRLIRQARWLAANGYRSLFASQRSRP